MATYAIGDIQGCANEFDRLLDHLNFDERNDRVWLTGDLVNRGPNSLAVIERARALGTAAEIVLGNHDLHLLVCALVPTISPKKKDTFGDVLESPNRDDLMDWLRRLPLIVRDHELKFTMVHAGIPPIWSIDEAAERAAEVESVLRSNEIHDFLENMYGNSPDQWTDSLKGMGRLRLITNFFTRLRFLHRDGRLDFKHKGQVGGQPPDLIPWYDLYPASRERDSIVFGHWSALHLSQAQMDKRRVYALDTGAVWGGDLTAMRLEDRRVFSVPSAIALPIDD